MKLSELFTTTDIINSKKDQQEKLKESQKMLLTNDGYAIASILEIYLRRLSNG